MTALDNYIKYISNGVTNGYAFIDALTDGQIAILCNIITAITGSEPLSDPSRDDVKDFTSFVTQEEPNSKAFERYVKNVQLAYEDLVRA